MTSLAFCKSALPGATYRCVQEAKEKAMGPEILDGKERCEHEVFEIPLPASPLTASGLPSVVMVDGFSSFYTKSKHPSDLTVIRSQRYDNFDNMRSHAAKTAVKEVRKQIRDIQTIDERSEILL